MDKKIIHQNKAWHIKIPLLFGKLSIHNKEQIDIELDGIYTKSFLIPLVCFHWHHKNGSKRLFGVFK